MFDAALFDGEDGEGEIMFADGLAFGGEAAELIHDVAADGIEAGSGGDVDVEGVIEVVDGDGAINDEGSIIELADGGIGLAVEFVGEIADDFFDEVFEGDEAGGAAIFVNDDGELGFELAELAEEFVDFFCFGDEEGGAHDVGEGRRLRGARAPEGERVTHVEDADDMIEIAFVDGEAGVAGLLRALNGLVEGA